MSNNLMTSYQKNILTWNFYLKQSDRELKGGMKSSSSLEFYTGLDFREEEDDLRERWVGRGLRKEHLRP